MAPKTKSEQLYSLSARRDTFRSAPLGRSKQNIGWDENFPVSARLLSECGFFYCPTQKNRYQVSCFMCKRKENAELWKGTPSQNEILSLHLNKGTCCFAVLIKCMHSCKQGKFEWMEYPELESAKGKAAVGLRKSTFGKLWGMDKVRKAKSRSDKVAEAGFFYTSVDFEDDLTICAYCGVPLEGWEQDDDPMEEHKRRSPGCYFFKCSDERDVEKGIEDVEKGMEESHFENDIETEKLENEKVNEIKKDAIGVTEIEKETGKNDEINSETETLKETQKESELLDEANDNDKDETFSHTFSKRKRFASKVLDSELSDEDFQESYHSGAQKEASINDLDEIIDGVSKMSAASLGNDRVQSSPEVVDRLMRDGDGDEIMDEGSQVLDEAEVVNEKDGSESDVSENEGIESGGNESDGDDRDGDEKIANDDSVKSVSQNRFVPSEVNGSVLQVSHKGMGQDSDDSLTESSEESLNKSLEEDVKQDKVADETENEELNGIENVNETKSVNGIDAFTSPTVKVDSNASGGVNRSENLTGTSANTEDVEVVKDVDSRDGEFERMEKPDDSVKVPVETLDDHSAGNKSRKIEHDPIAEKNIKENHKDDKHTDQSMDDGTCHSSTASKNSPKDFLKESTLNPSAEQVHPRQNASDTSKAHYGDSTSGQDMTPRQSRNDPNRSPPKSDQHDTQLQPFNVSPQKASPTIESESDFVIDDTKDHKVIRTSFINQPLAPESTRHESITHEPPNAESTPPAKNPLQEPVDQLSNASKYLKSVSQSEYSLNDDVDGILTHFISEMPDFELDMTIRTWINYQADQAKRLFVMNCDSMIDEFKKQGERAVEDIKRL